MIKGRPLVPLIGLAMAVMGSGVAGYLTYTHGNNSGPVCVVFSGCSVVAQSAYAELWNIPTAAYGLLLYLVLAVLFSVRVIAQPPSSIQRTYIYLGLLLTTAGTGVSAWLTYIELYVLHAICLWCVVSALLVTGILCLSITDVFIGHYKKNPSSKLN